MFVSFYNCLTVCLITLLVYCVYFSTTYLYYECQIAVNKYINIFPKRLSDCRCEVELLVDVIELILSLTVCTSTCQPSEGLDWIRRNRFIKVNKDNISVNIANIYKSRGFRSLLYVVGQPGSSKVIKTTMRSCYRRLQKIMFEKH